MMDSLPSGSLKEKELVVIETGDLTCIIKGKAEHPKYNKLQQHMSFKVEDAMQFQCRANGEVKIEVYDVLIQQLVPYEEQNLLPVFFENGRYEIIIIPNNKESLIFYHEYPEFREAIGQISRGNILTGTLHFQNEVGLTSFEVRDEKNNTLVEVMLEIYPTKLDYKKDYKDLLNEVNEEVYNLAYHFIKRTYLRASAKIYKEPSLTEFYRIIEQHYKQYIRAIDQVEKTSHHQLIKTYKEVRGNQLRRQDQKSLNFLRKNADKFIDISNGFALDGRNVMPTKGLLIKKEHNMDTHENRYVKWTMIRIGARLKNLKEIVSTSNKWGNNKKDNELMERLNKMIEQVEKRQKRTFWRKVGKLDRSVMNMVLQMAPGYREVLQVYTIVSKSLVLQGSIYKMSIKDIATLYEYWTFLKLGQILARKCTQISQDIVKVNRDGLFVNLDKSKRAERKYIHPVTGERITLRFQYDTSTANNRVPTVQQKPDSMLSISKNGKSHEYQYIFDAKYRLDLETDRTPGPMQEDINTMHRYRDSIVVNTGERYERTAFGAYVLFPWREWEEYQTHRLYQSIEQVNIGGLPFLPNATELVEQFIENLLNKSAEQLQQEGILPKGTQVVESNLYSTDYVMICLVDKMSSIKILKERKYSIPIYDLISDLQRVTYISMLEEGSGQISNYARVNQMTVEGENLLFTLDEWKDISINCDEYLLHNHAMFYINSFLNAKQLTDLYTRTREEEILWRLLTRISNEVKIDLDNIYVDEAKKISAYRFKHYYVEIDRELRNLYFSGPGFKELLNLDLVIDNETYIFKRLAELIYPETTN